MASRRPGWSDRADPPGRPPRRGGHHQPRRQRRADPRVPRRPVHPHGVRRRAGLHELSGRSTPRARADAGRRPRRVGLAAARRRQPRARCAGRAAGRRRGAAGRRDPGPQAAGVALAASPPRGRADHHRHRSPRDWSRARRVRPGPARRGPRGARRQHGRHAGAPAGARGARWARRGAADLRQRHRLRLACGARRPPHPRRAAGRGVPRRGRPPWAASYAADRAPHPLPGAAGRAVHLAGQRQLARPPVAVRPAVLRLAAAGARLPRRPVRGGGPRRARCGPVRPRSAGTGRGGPPVAGAAAPG